MSELDKIAENKVKSPITGEEIELKSLWENQTCVITFFRRFGCGFCRLAAKELSSIKPELDAHNVRLVGIGLEDLGAEKFMSGDFFDGDLFIDIEKKCYKDMEYKRYGIFSTFVNLATKPTREAISKARSENVGGDMKGDLYQVGGTLIVNKGGDKIIMNHKQEYLADHVSHLEVLKSLGIENGNETQKE